MAIQQIFFNPYTKKSGNFGVLDTKKMPNLQIADHDDHLHVASDNREEMVKLINEAQSRGLRCGENPYSDDHIEMVHKPDSWHYYAFPAGAFNVGCAVDITGDYDTIEKFIDDYLYGTLKAGEPENKTKYPSQIERKSSNMRATLIAWKASGKIGLSDEAIDGLVKGALIGGAALAYKYGVSTSDSNPLEYWSPEKISGRVQSESVIKEEIQRIKNLMK